MESKEIQKAIDAAADAIATREPTSWPMRVVYLLEVLEQKLEGEDVRLGDVIMKEVSLHLNTRLIEGHWL